MYSYVQTIWFAEQTSSDMEKMSIVVLGTAMAAFHACAIVRDSSGRLEWVDGIAPRPCMQPYCCFFFYRNLPYVQITSTS